MNTSEMLTQVIDTFFGDSYANYNNLLDQLIVCSSLDKFKSLKSDLTEDMMANIFHNCLLRDHMSEKFNDRESRRTYLRLKAVSQNCDFI